MTSQIGNNELIEIQSLLMSGLEQELTSLKNYIDSVKSNESQAETDKRVLLIKAFHNALEISKLVNLATIATKVAHMASLNSQNTNLTIALTGAVNLISSCNALALSQVDLKNTST